MGSRQSTASQRVRHTMLPSPFHYHPISPSNSPTQPLLHNYNQHSMFQNLEAKAQQEKTAALERENGVLRSVVSSLESKLLSKERDTEVKCRNTNLESEVNELKIHVAELCSQLKHGKAEKTKLKEAIKNVKKRYAALEDKLDKVSTNIADMKIASSHDSLNAVTVVMSDATMPQSEMASTKMDHAEIPNKENDIAAACLLVLIILVSILVGINL